MSEETFDYFTKITSDIDKYPKTTIAKLGSEMPLTKHEKVIRLLHTNGLIE